MSQPAPAAAGATPAKAASKAARRSRHEAKGTAAAPDEAARSRRVLGDGFWSYGVAGNRPALEALCRYSHAQGIAARPVTVDELFVPATMDWLPS